MPIPKNIYQTFKTKKLPLLTRFHIWNLRRKNPEYAYHFFDDSDVEAFIQQNFEASFYNAYKKLTIGAAKADFFRYAVLYINGGVYLDLDSLIVSKIDNFVFSDDEAIISLETHGVHYCQWALFFNKKHPFLWQTLIDIVENIDLNKYPKDVHKTTGPTAFTKAIKKVISKDDKVPYRELKYDYEGNAKFSYPLSKFFMYGFQKKEHWKKNKAI